MAAPGNFLRCLPLFLLALWPEGATSHREHKVHNIVLYPDKHSWCQTTPIKQVVGGVPGNGVDGGGGGNDGGSGDGGAGGGGGDCESVEIDNHVCVGACFSYTIPRTLPSSPGDAIKPYCDSCQPSAVQWKEVTLECGGGGGEDDTTLGGKSIPRPRLTVVRRVQVITNCSCSACDVTDPSHHGPPPHPGHPHHSSSFASLHPDGLLETHHASEGHLHPPHPVPISSSDEATPGHPSSGPSSLNRHHHHHHHHRQHHHPAESPPAEFPLPPSSLSDPPQHLSQEISKGKPNHEVPELMDLMRETHERKASGGGVGTARPEIEEKLRNLWKLVAPGNAEAPEGGIDGNSALAKRLDTEAHVRVDEEVLRRVLGDPGAGGSVAGKEAAPGGADPTLEVAPHSLRPARDGAEMSYHDNPSPGSPAEEGGRKRTEKEEGEEEEF